MHFPCAHTRVHLDLQVSGFGMTVEYASPETLQHGSAKSGPQSDLWSFGIMLLELVLGELPPVSVSADAHSSRRAWGRLHACRLLACMIAMADHPSAPCEGSAWVLRGMLSSCSGETP